ncbi:hypothetical protein ROJ8625_03365 [Roseivivax jejudonensis]|uniref:DUF421 domain-containing protein n=1 Tax=Roseivivax jejudonensis TaxID=1529041 RepID=A0A1X6ZZP2_9RHOB|nr:YetF domain-containing protein [Roseivivax jejudonensis]SLN65788.1 hypothetical protein ROJ8625_03365 [Roseivivax jejudonensis]
MEMLYQGWEGIVRTLVVGTLAYVALVAVLRVTGNRTLSKLNAFDLVVTVALGSVLASILLSEGVALAEGVTAFLLLIGLQYGVAMLSVKSRRFAKLVRSEPRLLLRDGEPLPQAMHEARVTRDELDTVMRTSGYADRSAVSSIILESDGSFSVIGKDTETRGRASVGTSAR